MSLADLFRPKWKHSDPLIRAQAVQDVKAWTSAGSAILAGLSSTDPHLAVRLAALGCLPLHHPMLTRLASMDQSPAVRQAAIERLAAWPWTLRDLVKSSPNRGTRLSALDLIPEALARHDVPALNTKFRKDAELAQYLFDIAESAQDSEIRATAVNRLADLAGLPRIREPDEPAPQANYEARLHASNLFNDLPKGSTVDVARMALTTLLPTLGPGSLDDYSRTARLPEIREAAAALVPEAIARALATTRLQTGPHSTDKQMIVGSWEIPKPDDFYLDYAIAHAQRIEFFDDGSVRHFIGGTRTETASLKSEPERAAGSWELTDDQIHAEFKLGREWGAEREGQPMRRMMGILLADDRMTVWFTATSPPLQWRAESKTLFKRE